MLHARFPQNGWPPYAHFWLGEFQKWPTATAPGSPAKIRTSVGSEPRGRKKKSRRSEKVRRQRTPRPDFRRLGTPMPKIGLFRLDPMLFLPRVATYMPKMANLGQLTCLNSNFFFDVSCLIPNFGKFPPLKIKLFACKFPM